MSMVGIGRSCVGLLMAATVVLLVPSTGAAQEQVRRYTIQAVATSTPAQAEERAQIVRQELGPVANVRVEHHPPYHTVRVGYYSTANEARQMLSRIWELGYRDAWIARAMVSASELAREAGVRTDSQVRPAPAEPSAEEEVQPVVGPVGGPVRKTMRALRVEGPPPNIDGRLDDPGPEDLFDVGTNSRTNYSTFEGNWWDRYRGYDLDRNGRGDVAHAPVRLFALLVEQSPPALILTRSVLVDLLDIAERVLPALSPETLRDAAPLMHPPRKLP